MTAWFYQLLLEKQSSFEMMFDNDVGKALEVILEPDGGNIGKKIDVSPGRFPRDGIKGRIPLGSGSV